MKRRSAFIIHIILAILIILSILKIMITDRQISSSVIREKQEVEFYFHVLKDYYEAERLLGEKGNATVNILSFYKERFTQWDDELVYSVELGDLPELVYNRDSILAWIKSGIDYRNIYLVESLEDKRTPLFKVESEIKENSKQKISKEAFLSEISLNKLMSSETYLEYLSPIIKDNSIKELNYYPVRIIEEKVSPKGYASLFEYAYENKIKSLDIYLIFEMVIDHFESLSSNQINNKEILERRKGDFYYHIYSRKDGKTLHAHGERPDELSAIYSYDGDLGEVYEISYIGKELSPENSMFNPVIDAFLERTAEFNFKTLIVLLFLEILASIWLAIATYQEMIRKTLFGSVPTEVAILMVVFGIFLCFQFFKIGNDFLFRVSVSNQIILYCFEVLNLIAAYGIALCGFVSLMRRIRTKEIFTNSLLYYSYKYIKKAFDYLHQQTRESILAVINIIGLFVMTFVLVRFLGGFGWLFSFIVHLLVANWYLKIAMEREYIIKGLAIIGGGNLDYQLDETKLHGKNKVLGRSVNQVGQGLKVAVETSVVNEKMQAELITNISHDLKTPLTSIINYINLLQQPNLSLKDQEEYIQIISKKADRLKRLTEDVVEISRSSSGKIQMDYQLLDMSELMPQLMVDWDDRFKLKKLDVKLDIQVEPAIVYADGRQTFRILENCFSNIDKYALENSRVYITISRASQLSGRDYIRITMKNISSVELNIPPEALFDKFTRGNKARTGPSGSGLGLSIARNLSRLQGGEMNIQIDGDLFKIILDLPIGRTEEDFKGEQE